MRCRLRLQPVDHDQRNTLNVGFNATLPWRTFVSTNVYYGSGFVNGDPRLPPRSNTPIPTPTCPSTPQSISPSAKTFSENLSASVTATNVANHRVLLDNSLTFGGFHYNDPRQIYGQLRYRFKF